MMLTAFHRPSDLATGCCSAAGPASTAGPFGGVPVTASIAQRIHSTSPAEARQRTKADSVHDAEESIEKRHRRDGAGVRIPARSDPIAAASVCTKGDAHQGKRPCSPSLTVDYRADEAAAAGVLAAAVGASPE